MTETHQGNDLRSTEVLDLYDVLPPANHRSEAGAEHLTAMIRQVGRNLAAIVGMFAVALVSFVACVVLFSVGVSLAVLVVGLFILVGCLIVAGWSTQLTRRLLRYAGVSLPATRYPAAGQGFGGKLRRLAHAQSWRDLLFVLINFVLSTASFSIAVSWVVAGPGGVTYWFWSRFLPEDDRGLPELLGFPGRFADVAFNEILGVIMLLTLPLVLHGLVRLHGAVAGALLVDETSALRQQVSELTSSRTAAGDAEVQTLRRLERDLHDGPQQRLVRLGMDISAAQRRLVGNPEQARALLDEAFTQSQEALAEIRTLSRGIAPPILAEQGLKAAVTALAARGSIPTSVDVQDLPMTEPVRNAAYFVVAEALANLEKHSRATTAAVEIYAAGALAVISVSDDGAGGASMAKGHGLAGLADRLAGVDGSLTVISPAGGPTRLTATLPLAALSS
jgi:signal transduction histidine kinase